VSASGSAERQLPREADHMQSVTLLIARGVVLGSIAVLIMCGPALAVTSGGMSEQAAPADDDYAQGKAAFEREDWPEVVEHMTRVIAERPWHDDAHNLLGFAYRKLGDYDRALEAYDRALDLNPHHRGALEYLGEAYLELDRPELAKEMLDRLAAACQQVAVRATAADAPADCEEWRELKGAYDSYRARADAD
jgi:tetratricopeptide (TPR) repeat protein